MIFLKNYYKIPNILDGFIMLKVVILIFLLTIHLLSKEPISALPLKIEVDKQKANLGRDLFFDPILSKDNTISCNTCHIISNAGVDNLRFSSGISGIKSDFNTPSVFNAVFNFSQFWNGRAKNLEEQVLISIQSPFEMDMNFDDLIDKLSKTKYLQRFEDIYKDGLNIKNLANSISEYERTLVSPNSPFDRFLRGDKNAISDEAKMGYESFINQGCIACHHGINVGGNLYAKFGSVVNLSSKKDCDLEFSNQNLELCFFKVPSLRNVELTSPYLHNVSIDDLKETIKFMAYYQLGQSLDEEEIENIYAFLKSLTGGLL